MRGLPDSRSVLALYAIVLLSWSGAWFAIKLQIGTTAPAVSIALRFGLAAPVMFAWVLLNGGALRFGWRRHALFALMGMFLFSVNFIFAYHASAYLMSALVSVVFSLSAAVNLALGALLQRQRVTAVAVAGSLAGTAGLLLMLWEEVVSKGLGSAPLLGLALALGMTLSFCIGNMASAAVQKRLVPVPSATAWAMLWGAVISFAFAVLSGQPLAVVWSVSYAASLAFLVVLGTVIAFHAYLTLLGKVGAFRASYVTVMVPVGALLISSLLEGYHWTALAFAGLALTVGGNVLILRSRLAKPVAATTTTASPKGA